MVWRPARPPEELTTPPDEPITGHGVLRVRQLPRAPRFSSTGYRIPVISHISGEQTEVLTAEAQVMFFDLRSIF
jgi:hypothetical protein